MNALHARMLKEGDRVLWTGDVREERGDLPIPGTVIAPSVDDGGIAFKWDDSDEIGVIHPQDCVHVERVTDTTPLNITMQAK